MARHRLGTVGSLLVAGLCALAAAEAAEPASPGTASAVNPETARAWIQEFKRSPKGPFDAVRWYCRDGAVLEPRPGACASHGGGIQHGRWNERARTLRANGYEIANVLAELETSDFVGRSAKREVLAQILLERFLIGADDGWIFRGARSYRGALQSEDEEAGARRLVLAMLDDPGWRAPERFLLLRESVRLLPLQNDPDSAARVRQMALDLAARDAGFATLRAKIHNAPDAGDAARVRAYVAQPGGRRPAAEYYESLASAIDALYQARAGSQALRDLAAVEGDAALVQKLRAHADALAAASDPSLRFARGSLALADLRDSVAAGGSPEQRLARLQASLALESEVFAAGNQLATQLGSRSRREQLGYLETGAAALYGAGFLSDRQRRALGESVARATRNADIPLGQLRAELRQLARAPEWSARALAFQFGLAEQRFLVLEPQSGLHAQDRLRGSPLLFVGAVLDSLVLDANRLAGVEYEIFGARVGSGLRALNPGLARGPLVVPDPGVPLAGVAAGGIPLLPETISDLPAVAGILTRGEGSALSHIQLLARNLGIPNVVVGDERVPEVQARAGRQVVLAVSPGGVVQLDEAGPRFDRIFESAKSTERVVIRPDLAKLDLAQQDFVPLESLRASDSGRVSGPKGANLGELRAAFGSRVPDGFVIPFGAFRRLLDQPLEAGGPSVFDWMKQQYAALATLAGRPAEQTRAASDFLARLRAWIERADPGPAFRERLARTLVERFGKEGSYGVFVRSDTNIEDLPEFTGAGLNLTISNVVGTQQVLEAIRRVWASPFTERAYSWRQSHMEQPEYVFPAVVVQRSFPSEKSGVMVSSDVSEGEPGWITVVANEGVSGAVDGQAAESLRVSMKTGEVRLLAQATAPLRNVLAAGGGIAQEPASGAETLLAPGEITQLVALAEELPTRVETLRGEDGATLPADVEFAFSAGQLTLLQIRPLVESRSAQRNAYLLSLDAGARGRAAERIPLDAPPGARSP